MSQEQSKRPLRKDITYAEVAKHNTDQDCWIIIKNNVYSVSEYLDDHPGGPVVISNRGGKDVTKPFDDAGHSDSAQKKLESFLIGSIKEGDVPLPGQIDGAGSSNSAALFVVAAIVAVILYFVFFASDSAEASL